MRRELFQDTGQLARFMLRRDRVRAPLWILCIVIVTMAAVSAFPGLYPTGPERQILAETMQNPALTSMLGPMYGVNDYNVGAMTAHQMLLFTALAVAIMSILLVTRHTRGDEESGRLEMIRSFPVGRLANVTAALLVVSFINVALGAVVGFGLFALGIDSVDFAGSMLYGAVLTATGIFFTATTALFAQLSETSRGALGIGFGFLISSYVVRAAGDVGSEALSLISPLGLILRAEVYVNNYWWPVAVTVAGGVAMGIVALYLNSVRDLEAGLIPARPGRSHASTFLASPLGLASRLQRPAIIAWAIGMFILGASYGSVFGDIETFFSGSDLIQQLLPMTDGVSLTDQFLSLLMAVLAMVGAIPALSTMLKLHGEERAGRTEHLLARAVSRPSLMASYLIPAVGLALLTQLSTAAGLWSAAAPTMEEPFAFGTVMRAALAYVPANVLMVALAALLIGFLPARAALVWLYLGYSFIVIYFGGLLNIPEWMALLTPYGHVPELPVEDMNLLAVIALTFIAATLFMFALRAYRRRDVYG